MIHIKNLLVLTFKRLKIKKMFFGISLSQEIPMILESKWLNYIDLWLRDFQDKTKNLWDKILSLSAYSKRQKSKDWSTVLMIISLGFVIFILDTKKFKNDNWIDILTRFKLNNWLNKSRREILIKWIISNWKISLKSRLYFFKWF